MREERHDGTVAAILDGEMDTASVGEVAVKLRRLVENQQLRLVIDLSAVTYLDSAGINLLYAVAGRACGRASRSCTWWSCRARRSSGC